MPKPQQKITNISNNSYLYTQMNDFVLVSGKVLHGLKLAFETYGELNGERNNVILLHHSLSMSAHAYNSLQNDINNDQFDYDHKTHNGWWDNMIGPGKPLDPEKYFIICINNLGSCFGSSGPNNYDGDFPVITIHDMVKSQKILLDFLNINKLKLIIGSSMGGMLSLSWLQLYPETVDNLFVAACAHKAYPINIYNRMIQQEMIKLDTSNTKAGLKLARMLGFFNYRSSDELTERFSYTNVIFDQEFNANDSRDIYKSSEMYNYFSYNADKFTAMFETESYQCLLTAMDLFDLSIEKNYHPAGYPNFNPSTNITIVSIDTDILFPVHQQQDVFNLLKQYGYNPKFIEHKSKFGHDAFLVEHQIFGQYLSDLL